MKRHENGGLTPHPGSCTCQRCHDILRDVLHLSLLGEREPVILPAVPRPHTCTCGAECTGTASPDGSHASGVTGAVTGVPGIPLWDEARHKVLAEMSGPMTLPEGKLPSYDAIPPGCCRGCHLPIPAGAATCFYCGLLAGEQKTEDLPCDHGNRMQCMSCYPAAKTRRGPHRVTVLLVIALALGILSVTLWPEAALGSWTCLVLAAFALPRRQK